MLPDRTHDTQIRVTYRDTDQMSVVYYANYFVYMETGRTEYIRARGWPYRRLESDGLGLPVLRAECDYKLPARYDDLLRVRTILESATRVQVVFRYEIYCDDRAQLLATGLTRHAFVDLAGKLKRAPHEIVERLLAPAPHP